MYYWLDVASDFLQLPLTDVAHTEIAGHLIRAFDVTTLTGGRLQRPVRRAEPGQA
jgi:hypothetical protein